MIPEELKRWRESLGMTQKATSESPLRPALKRNLNLLA
jgi:hypothetical protein